jgi:hypothetical protein
MIDLADKNKSVHELLEASRIAKDAAEIAAGDNNRGEMCRLRQKSRELRADANTLDPAHECAAWDKHLRGTH